MAIKAVKHDDKGLSLLEVLVAVFVLAVVTVPLLNIFVANTTLLRKAHEKTDTTYDAKAMMESLYTLGYPDLFMKGTGGAPVLDAGSGRYYTLGLSPSGPPGVVPGVTNYCYMHLIVNNTGTGTFAGPDGKLQSGSLPAIGAEGLTGLSLDAPAEGTAYTLTAAGTTVTGTKPEGAVTVLIVNTRLDSAVIRLTVSPGSSVAVLAYTPASFLEENLTVNNALAMRLYNNGDPPQTMLVKALLKTYTGPLAGTQDGVYQDTLEAGALP